MNIHNNWQEVIELKNEIITELSQNYGLGESDARELLAIPDQAEYTQRIQQIAGV